MWNYDDHRALRELLREDDRQRAESEELMPRRKTMASPLENAPAPALYEDGVPSYADDGFSEVQLAALTTIVDGLHREFDAAIERAQQRMLETMLRLVRSGEAAEQKAHLLDDRVALLERSIERRVAEALTDKGIIDLPRDFWKRDAA